MMRPISMVATLVSFQPYITAAGPPLFQATESEPTRQNGPELNPRLKYMKFGQQNICMHLQQSPLTPQLSSLVDLQPTNQCVAPYPCSAKGNSTNVAAGWKLGFGHIPAECGATLLA